MAAAWRGRRGTFAEAVAGVFSSALGGDDELRRAPVSVLHYIPVRPDLYLGFRGVVAGTFRDVQHAMNRSPDSLGHSTHHLLDMVRFSEDFE